MSCSNFGWRRESIVLTPIDRKMSPAGETKNGSGHFNDLLFHQDIHPIALACLWSTLAVECPC